ncbi:guanylate kinase [Lutibacter sp.]|uniref:guanylate kinase n=1 Tax=Lutibacter sp. TaxID=1925666 RepID=UPI002733D4E4|nr:guanylate kinase [Lutibacter sp.]MDP3314288.1 guanylate kinase [Lutibacter sp.]
MNKDGKLIVFSAPSGSGKTTIVQYLLKHKELNLEFSISATSREKRGIEIDGKDYYFITLKKFNRLIKNEEFVEWEEVYANNYYGTLKTEIERIWKLGKHVIFDIDVIGGLNIKNKFPKQTLAIFVKSPSVEEMERRLRNRGTDSDSKIKERVIKAEKELKYAKDFDVILHNNELDDATKEAYQLVEKFIK